MESETQDSVQTEKSNGGIKLSIGKGMSFLFEHNGHQIEFWISLISGREKVLVNGELVSKKWSYRTTSEHQFAIEGKPYSVRFETVSLLRYHFNCSLIKNDSIIQQHEIRDYSDEQGFFRRNAIVLFSGTVVGVLLVLEIISLPVAALLLIITVFLSLYKDLTHIQPVSDHE